jgi:DNA-binding GntR family transcriptional regulator
MINELDYTVSGSSLSAGLFSRIREDILQGILKDGEKLTEQKICEAYNVSRTPVREAFKQLETDGLLENIPNRGAFVRGFSEQDKDDLYELRKSGEILAVKWGIARITESELDDLKEAYEFMEFYTQRRDYPKMLNINATFHELISKASHNRLLIQSLSLYQLYARQARARSSYSDHDLAQVLAEHKEILDAFIEKDPLAGMAAMGRHLDSIRKRKG